MFRLQVLIVLALCLMLPLNTLGQGQAYWLPPAAGGGISPSSPYTSGYSVQPQAFYGQQAAPAAMQPNAGAALPPSKFLEISSKLRGSAYKGKKPSHK
jgi:hypothetical protein|eukprot:g9166.t1